MPDRPLDRLFLLAIEKDQAATIAATKRDTAVRTAQALAKEAAAAASERTALQAQLVQSVPPGRVFRYSADLTKVIIRQGNKLTILPLEDPAQVETAQNAPGTTPAPTVEVPTVGGLGGFLAGLLAALVTALGLWAGGLIQPTPRPAPPPNPAPTPKPPKPTPPAKAALLVYLVRDMADGQDTKSPQLIAGMDKIQEQLVALNAKFRWYALDDDRLKAAGVLNLVQQAGGAPVLVIQAMDSTKPALVQRPPSDAQGVLALVKKVRGVP